VEITDFFLRGRIWEREWCLTTVGIDEKDNCSRENTGKHIYDTITHSLLTHTTPSVAHPTPPLATKEKLLGSIWILINSLIDISTMDLWGTALNAFV